MSADATVTVEQKHVTCWCGIAFMVPNNLYEQVRKNVDQGLRQTGRVTEIYCPLGHNFTYGVTTEVQRLRDELAGAQGRLDQVRAELCETQMELTKKTRKLRRVEKGTCPHCQRHFVNVARHMKTKHPEPVSK